jgi:hypothetical protein
MCLEEASSMSDLPLRVRTADLGAELFVLDHTFTIVHTGVGELDVAVPRGHYKVRMRIGSTLREVHVALEPERSRMLGTADGVALTADAGGVTVDFHATGFASPIPLANTASTHEHHFGNAASISGGPAMVKSGAGATVFVFSRAWSPTNRDVPSRRFAGWHPMAGLSLHDRNGKAVCELEARSKSDLTRVPWAGTKVTISPGCYVLRQQRDSGVFDMPLIAPRNWQLQVFLLGTPERNAGPDHPQEPRPPVVDLGRVAVLLANRPFDHTEVTWRLTEQARQGLSLRRATVRPQDLHDMLFAKVSDPMLGIYGGHLLLLKRERDEGLLRDIVHRLRDLVGVHPDVEALALACGLPPVDPRVFHDPPMLNASWDLIVRATADQPELVPEASRAASASRRLWSSGGPWLAWSATPDGSLAETDPVGVQLWQYWLGQYKAAWPSQPRTPAPDQLAPGRLVAQLAMPLSVVTMAARAVAARLDDTGLPSVEGASFAATAIASLAGGNDGLATRQTGTSNRGKRAKAATTA